MHHYQDLIQIFHDCFFKDYQTVLVCGEDEPLYQPADEHVPYHRVIFAHGFFSSALHECAHWCLAGEKRRLQMDYGYWYEPDGRSPEQQALFFQVEVKPQAIEKLFSQAAGFRFVLSVDNLTGQSSDSDVFVQNIEAQVLHYQQHGLPTRAAIFYDALVGFYQVCK